ncbi:stalk domain-containing protein [Paenibacillus sp. GCM10027629]|uniref:stalk domain-containing protein n=1 Tax=Paenibacillus sp. GCM10027629 TaxID=3273414 RepID=UPI003632CDC0
MRKPIQLQLVIALVFILSFASIPSALAETSLIPDKNLEQAIRIELKKPTGAITKKDLASLTSLYPEDPEKKVGSLIGLEHAVNLESLMLPGLGIKDISPLKDLHKVTFLALSGNQIRQLEPLQGLHQLEQLMIDANEIEKLDTLAGLTNLTDLLIGHNRIKDLSPIQSLTKLSWLIVSDNQIESLEPLRNHPNIEHLYIENNQIQDISVLTTLPKLQEVSLSNNPLDANAEKVLAELTAKGVKVLEDADEQSTPPSEPDGITVLLNNELLKFQAPPIQKNGSVLVPFRAIFEALGLKVDWDPKAQSITGSKANTLIKLKVGSGTAEVNGKQMKLTAAPSTIGGSTYVPLRFIGEAVDAKVDWQEMVQTAAIYTKQPFATKDKKIQITAYQNWSDVTSSIENAGDHQLILFSSVMSTMVIQHYSKSDLDMSFDEYVSFAKKDLTDRYGMKMTEQSVKVGKIDAKQLNYSLIIKNKTNEYRMILFEQNNEFYTLLLTTPPQVSKQANAEFNEILTSIKIS